jgi:hypothetical protein
MLIGEWRDEAWTFYDKVTREIMGEVERHKELWETLDELIGSLPGSGPRQEFREMLFTLSSNSISESTERTRDLVRRWLSVNDPGGGYRLTR